MAETPLDEGATVRASVQFSIDTGETPVAVVYQPGDRPDDRKASFEQREIVVHDGRPAIDSYNLDVEGFTFRRFPTAVKDFFDDEEVRRVYYPEMETLVKQETGASRVIVFDHTIRVGDDDMVKTRKLRTPVRNVHNDFTIRSAPQRVRDLAPDEAEALLKKRFGSINVWRPLTPVENDPLVIAEYGSIDDADLIAAERHYPDGRIGGVYHLAYNPNQRWTYFPHMTPDEVIVLKCYDSRTDLARWTAHGSFDDPNAPENAAPRQSIEIRTLYFFD